MTRRQMFTRVLGLGFAVSAPRSETKPVHDLRIGDPIRRSDVQAFIRAIVRNNAGVRTDLRNALGL